MGFDYQCISKLRAKNLFHDTDHMTRFSDLVTCYCNYPFFSKGLVKCMYLSSWDNDHYAIILDILNDMTLERSRNTTAMEDNGKSLEYDAEGRDVEIIRLSSSFLTGEEYTVDYSRLDAQGVEIVDSALIASQIIDDSFR